MEWIDPGTVRVAIAEGQALVRGGLHALLEGQPDMTVVGEAGDGEEAVAVAERQRPDVILIDNGLPAMDGLDATRRILDTPALADVRVVVLSASESDEHRFGHEVVRQPAAESTT